MFTQTGAEENTASVLTPAPDSRMPWRVAGVEATGERTLRVRFLDGLSGTVRFDASYFEGVFASLNDAALFAQVAVVRGAVTWPNGIDLAPDAMHAAIKAHGEWVLR